MESLGTPLSQPSASPSASHEGAWRFTAPTTDSSVPQARRAVRELLRRQSAPLTDDQLHGLLLIVSELVTNAVRHAALLSPELGVEVSMNRGWIRVAVEDSHPYRPKALAADPDQQHTGGRGLLLVKTVVAECGGVCDVEQTATGGKTIWAALPLSAAVTSSSPANPSELSVLPGLPKLPEL